MPHFCECGADTFICQLCGRIGCDTRACPRYMAADWIAKVGNVCRRHDEPELVRAFAARTHPRS